MPEELLRELGAACAELGLRQRRRAHRRDDVTQKVGKVLTLDGSTDTISTEAAEGGLRCRELLAAHLLRRY